MNGSVGIACSREHGGHSPRKNALADHAGRVSMVEGPFTPRPLITTGAGDHFNAGFCLGTLLGFDDALCVLTGVTTSQYYVRTARSPTLADLAALLRNWPVNGIGG